MTESTRPATDRGPAPFTTDWYAAPPAAVPPRRLALARRPALPIRLPGDRAAGAALGLALVAVIAIGALFEELMRRGGASRQTSRTAEPLGLVAAPGPPAEAAPPAIAPTAAPASPMPTTAPAPTPPPESAAPAGPTVALADVEGVRLAPGEGWFPRYRILTYYGHPHDPNMGILGEHPKEELLPLLRREAANYEAADPSRPVIPAFEVLATVAQRDPGADGTYLLDTDLATLTEYADFAERHGMLVFYDLQIGRNSVAAEIEKLRELLQRPHVHLALDPEFAIMPGQTPGIQTGELTAGQIGYAQETLARIVREHDLPPKILIVHQFREDMIVGKDELRPVPGVQLVIDADGFGPPELKADVYDILIRDDPVEWAGVKLFYRQDVPLMSPADVVGLTPPPDLVIYQ